jgi:hypothetical protein
MMRFTSKLLQASTPQVQMRRIKAIVEGAKAGGSSWAIISPMRGNWDETLGVSPQKDSKEFTERTNKLMEQEIQKDIRSMGLGFRKCQGVGQEEDGAQNRENSFFIPKITLKQAETLWHKYHQWGIVYGGPETGGRVTLMGPDGEMTDLGNFVEGRETGDNPDVKEDQFWTEYKTKPFVFK